MGQTGVLWSHEINKPRWFKSGACGEKARGFLLVAVAAAQCCGVLYLSHFEFKGLAPKNTKAAPGSLAGRLVFVTRWTQQGVNAQAIDQMIGDLHR